MSMMRMILDDCLIATCACALCFCVIFICRPLARLKYKYNAAHPVFPKEQVKMRRENVHVRQHSHHYAQDKNITTYALCYSHPDIMIQLAFKLYCNSFDCQDR
jgi:hypothetical protein